MTNSEKKGKETPLLPQINNSNDDTLNKNSLSSGNSEHLFHDPPYNSATILQKSGSLSSMNTTPILLFGCNHRPIVALFFILSFFTYFDRGGLSASLDDIDDQILNDNNIYEGIVAAVYLLGYCLTSPMFALLGSKFPPIKMSAIGMAVWCLGVALTGLLSSFETLVIARSLTGIGEASFLSFSATIIDVISPSTSRSAWLGFFYMGIPLGYACGYGIGGSIVSSSLYHKNGNNESWRCVFLLECIVVLPLCFVLYFIKSPPNMLVIEQVKISQKNKNKTYPSNNVNKNDNSSNQIHDDSWKDKLIRIITNKSYLCVTVGYVTQTFVTGGFAVLTIQYCQKVYGLSAGTAGVAFGGITLIAGLTGSLLGGVILDWLKKDIPDTAGEHHFVNIALKLLILLTILSIPPALIIFQIHNKYLFFILVFICELSIFASTGPVNNAVLWTLLYKDRPLGMALNTLCIHALGDALSPLVINAIVQVEKKKKSEADAWNLAMTIASMWLFLSLFAFISARFTLKWLNHFMIQHRHDEHLVNQITFKDQEQSYTTTIDSDDDR